MACHEFEHRMIDSRLDLFFATNTVFDNVKYRNYK